MTRRSEVIGWIENGTVPADRIQSALQVTGILPDTGRWLRFLDRLMLALGALSLAASVVFFVAFNWDRLGRFAQFALLQGLLIVAVLFAVKRGPGVLSTQLGLTVAAILLGALLALFGQTYQTGADPWQLFACWALLIVPWVLASRFAPLWLLWLLLLNLSLLQYYDSAFGLLGVAFFTKDDLAWLLLLVNTAAWALWELAGRRFDWLSTRRSGRWAVRLVATVSGAVMTVLVLRAIFDPQTLAPPVWLVYFAWLVIVYRVYRRTLPDLFILAGACLSLIVSFTSLFAELMLKGGDLALSFLLLALLVVAQAAFAAVWLRRVHSEGSR
ncbi:MAG: DUF2157 domain-containing protein [Xanthomonadales bacterium]|nr:DUF2157 domain-containing protein [Xanthomonadales bacterium]